MRGLILCDNPSATSWYESHGGKVIFSLFFQRFIAEAPEAIVGMHTTSSKHVAS